MIAINNMIVAHTAISDVKNICIYFIFLLILIFVPRNRLVGYYAESYCRSYILLALQYPKLCMLTDKEAFSD